MFCSYSSMPWLVHDHWCIPTCANNAYIIVAVLSSLPPSESLSLTSGYWSFMFPCLPMHGLWWLQQSVHNLCTVTCNNTCLPQTHNTRLCWALPYKCWSKVCRVHVVLSALYQEKMVTEQEMEELKPGVWLWGHLVNIQWTKPPNVMNRTAELLAEVGCDEERMGLKGQWLCSVSLFICYLSFCFLSGVVVWDLQQAKDQ